jgi:hypothetical protein
MEQFSLPILLPFDSLLLAIVKKRGKTWGWRSTYLAATQHTEGARPVSNHEIDKWRNEDRIPYWAVEQVPMLTFVNPIARRGVTWSRQERRFLHRIYENGVALTNDQLADMCSQQFGRLITDNAIKGMLDRSRKLSLIDTQMMAAD